MAPCPRGLVCLWPGNFSFLGDGNTCYAGGLQSRHEAWLWFYSPTKQQRKKKTKQPKNQNQQAIAIYRSPDRFEGSGPGRLRVRAMLHRALQSGPSKAKDPPEPRQARGPPISLSNNI